MMSFNVYNDGDTVSKEKETSYNLRELNLPLIHNRLKLNFVGIITHPNLKPLVVFPKHYNYEKENLVDDVKLLIKVLEKGEHGLINQPYDYVENQTNFPLKAYKEICLYYQHYGLYYESKKKIEPGRKGRINWQYTINKSPKVLNKSNILFIPFNIENKENVNVFITECMIEVLAHGYASFGKYFDIGVKYKKNSPFFSSQHIQHILRKLHMIKKKYFKDTTRNLINNLISYLKWENQLRFDGLKLLTKNFEFIWEDMIQYYLNHYFLNVSKNGIVDNLVFSKNKLRKSNTLKKYSEYVEQNTPKENNFKMEFDHIEISHKEKEIILLDSKYYEKITGLNYKQVVYAYFLLNKYRDYKLINGLILPTKYNYYNKIHINREEMDHIFITEHYLNLKQVMNTYVI